ncbi:MAG: hypothetical protein Q9182_007049 [Xanthomendoza sp. 2 TL-2023]
MTPLPNVTDTLDSPQASFQPFRGSAASSPTSSSRHSQHNQDHQVHSRTGDPSSISFESQGDLPRQIILASFVPRVACFASEDTDDIAEEKGFPGGFYNLLRPFAEHVQGKVVIRDSVGASKAWDNFGIRIIQYSERFRRDAASVGQLDVDQNGEFVEEQSPVDGTEGSLDAMLHHILRSVRGIQHAHVNPSIADRLQGRGDGLPASGYVCYLRKLFSGAVQVPYETFSHPVACIIAVSSRSAAPLEKIRQLYSASGRGNNAIPPWVGVDYLRYYVLVHDEDRDDIIKSTALFDLMKRHFGLHCFLLRIRSLRCGSPDSESLQSPECQRVAAAEQLAEVNEAGYPCASTSEGFIFESDSLAIKSFIREMVTQSIVPFMESRVVAWNEQMASKRRGIGGRFMSLSKRWAGLGSTRGANPTTSTTPSFTNSNFDSSRGYYLPESPEAIMRQLADYAFMLRDFKMAFSTYDALRTDFSNDKAWSYHASANELASVSYLLIPQTLSIRIRSEVVDQKVEAALYSYITRCSLPLGAVRCILLIIELLIGREGGAAEGAAKWAIKALELGILSAIPQALMTGRISDFHKSQQGLGLKRLGSRKRQTAFWNTLASLLWTRLGKAELAGSRLRRAQAAMNSLGNQSIALPFPTMSLLSSRLRSKGTELGYEDGLSIRLDPVSSSEYAKGLVLDLTERPMYQERSPKFDSADAAGFSAIEAHHPDFEPAPSR